MPGRGGRVFRVTQRSFAGKGHGPSRRDSLHLCVGSFRDSQGAGPARAPVSRRPFLARPSRTPPASRDSRRSGPLQGLMGNHRLHPPAAGRHGHHQGTTSSCPDKSGVGPFRASPGVRPSPEQGVDDNERLGPSVCGGVGPPCRAWTAGQQNVLQDPEGPRSNHRSHPPAGGRHGHRQPHKGLARHAHPSQGVRSSRGPARPRATPRAQWVPSGTHEKLALKACPRI